MTTWDLKMRDPSEDLPLQKENHDVSEAGSWGDVNWRAGRGRDWYRVNKLRCSSEQHRRASRNLFPAENVRQDLTEQVAYHVGPGSAAVAVERQIRAVERRLEGIEQDIGTGGISAKGTLTRSGDLKANDFCCEEEAHAIDLGRTLQEQEERVLRLVGHMVEHLITSETREARMIREAAGVESRSRPPQGQLKNTPQSSRPGHQLACERPSSLGDLRKSIDDLRPLTGSNTTEVCSTAAETALADEKAPPGEDGDDTPHEVDTDLADLLKMRARLEEQLQLMDS
ncbi:hypothetical protein FOZ61_005672 [Perkinsus olseni]|uniref:Uncharacterized protein n=1 Tax=Perkinsus olseni TaxID=32597 RepID=A0A7J6LGG8_PEROL|nr:hypothetical protein FOL46_007780 [Perkinsus olseni]KAF4658389.1 hypothetical protein FOZ61_005672 [Perkinsus olseni]